MSAPKFTPDDMREAAEWLRCYEDDEGRERVRAVAEWLDKQADARERRTMISEIARKYHMTPSIARAALARARGEA